MVSWGQGVVLAALIVGPVACSRDNRQADIKRCIGVAEHQASHLLPSAPRDETAEERHDGLGDLVADYTEKQGYIESNDASSKRETSSAAATLDLIEIRRLANQTLSGGSARCENLP